MQQIIFNIFKAFIATCVFEAVPLLFFKNRWKLMATSLLCNALTNPLLNVILVLLWAILPNKIVYAAIVLALELVVVVYEAFIIRNVLDVKRSMSLRVSAICNAFSFGLGLVITFFEKI